MKVYRRKSIVMLLACSATFMTLGCLGSTTSSEVPVAAEAEPAPSEPESDTDPVATRPTVVNVTNGGGVDSTAKHTLHLSIGGPQPVGNQDTEHYQLQLGPGITP